MSILGSVPIFRTEKWERIPCGYACNTALGNFAKIFMKYLQNFSRLRNHKARIIRYFIFSYLVNFFLITCVYGQSLQELREIEGKVLLYSIPTKTAIILYFDEQGNSRRLEVKCDNLSERLYIGDIVRLKVFQDEHGQWWAAEISILERGEPTGIRKRLRRGFMRGIKKHR